MVISITEMLNAWAQTGVFSYVIPFLLIFATVFGILTKAKILGDNKGVNAIVAVAIGLLALQFDIVSTFFATIFPRFGVGLAVFLVLIILGYFFLGEKSGGKAFYIIGICIAGAVIIWTFGNWDYWLGSQFGFGSLIDQYFSWIVIVIIVLVAVGIIVGSSGGKKEEKKE